MKTQIVGRTKALSSSYHKLYKLLQALFITALLVVIILLMTMRSGEGLLERLLSVIIVIPYVCSIPAFIRQFNGIKDISYDHENLYINKKEGLEEQIPFYMIKDVELVSLNGIYRFNFQDKELHGGRVSCKTSLWYPFNHKKVDKEFNRVRLLIRKARKEHERQKGLSKKLPAIHLYDQGFLKK